MTRHHSITRLGKASLTKITKPIKAYNNLDLTKITDKRLFLKAAKRHFTDKTLKYERITLVEVGKFLSEKYELAKLFHNHYGRGLERLKLQDLEISQKSNNPIENAIKIFVNHLSIVKIKFNINPIIVNKDDIKKKKLANQMCLRLRKCFIYQLKLINQNMIFF